MEKRSVYGVAVLPDGPGSNQIGRFTLRLINTESPLQALQNAPRD